MCPICTYYIQQDKTNYETNKHSSLYLWTHYFCFVAEDFNRILKFFLFARDTETKFVNIIHHGISELDIKIKYVSFNNLAPNVLTYQTVQVDLWNIISPILYNG